MSLPIAMSYFIAIVAIALGAELPLPFVAPVLGALFRLMNEIGKARLKWPSEEKMPIRPEIIVDKLYEIALDPHELEGLIDVWTDAGLDDAQARATVEAINRFDEMHKAHLLRAHAFLERGEATDWVTNLSSVLDPFENLAAFIVDNKGGIQLSNAGAMQVFMLLPGQPLQTPALPLEVKDALETALSEAFASDDEAQIVVKAEHTAEESPLIMQVRRLATRLPDGRALALVVTTSYRWNETLGPMLGEVFRLWTHNQNKTVAARAMAERNTFGHRS